MAPPMSILAIGFAILLTVASAGQQFVPYSYTGTTGPEKWGSLSPSYSACSNGKAQSPINIQTKDAAVDPKLQPLLRNYSVTNATLVNNGYNIGLIYGSGVATANIDGKTYNLKQMHWHTPSEHTINGERFAAELHLVHGSSDGNVAVVAVLYRAGKPDPLVKQINESLNEMTREYCGEGQMMVPTHLRSRLSGRRPQKFYRYVGSLTVPPCVEKITWSILSKVREISKEQVEALKAPLPPTVKSNSRPLQPLNGRTVQLYNHGVV